MDQHSTAPRARVLLLVPPGGRRALVQVEAIFGREGMFDETFDVQEYSVEEPVGVAGFRLRAEAMRHYDVPAYGMAVSEPAGAVLAYSGDTALCQGLEALAADATLLLCEATLSEPEPSGALRGHLSAAEAAGVSRGELLLTHRPAELAPPAGLAVAREGLTVEI
jgi:ribonuclease BN (tRNA processing enzyme)